MGREQSREPLIERKELHVGVVEEAAHHELPHVLGHLF